MDSGLETALVSASIAAVVSISVAVISPLFTHTLWKRQKRKEQQLALAERFAALCAQMASFDVLGPEGIGERRMACKAELIGVLVVFPYCSRRKKQSFEQKTC
jgi:hypothetical protein